MVMDGKLAVVGVEDMREKSAQGQDAVACDQAGINIHMSFCAVSLPFCILEECFFSDLTLSQQRMYALVAIALLALTTSTSAQCKHGGDW